jgi:hypothetical protein
METKLCMIEGCVSKATIEQLCKSCFQRKFIKESIKNFEEKKEKKLNSKDICIGKTMKGEPCGNKQAENCGEFCKIHFKKESKKDASVTSEEPKNKCKGLTSKETPCLRYESFNCDGYCIQHYKSLKKEEKLEEKLEKLKI